MTRPDRAVIERMGDVLAACSFYGITSVTMPERMPLPHQELIVDLSNRIRGDGKEPDITMMIEYAAAEGMPPDRQAELFRWWEMPNVYACRALGPDGDPEHLRECIYRWSDSVRDELLVLAAARKIERGQDASAEIAKLRGGEA